MVNIKNQMKKFYSLPEIARILGISRIAVYKKVKSGKIKALKIGRNYAVPNNEFRSISGIALASVQKKVIDRGVKKTVKEYGEVLRLLGQE